MPDVLGALAEQVRQIDQLLPQTQCKQCGFEACLPYAESMAKGESDINRCPPGGLPTMQALATLLNKPAKPIDASCGETIERHIAVIDPEHCIGCTLCIKACPVDAIVGANKKRHAVIAPFCTGCELCIPPCPVDCIDMVFMPPHSAWTVTHAAEARTRLQQRQTRLVRQKQEIQNRLEAKAEQKLRDIDSGVAEFKDEAPMDAKKAAIEAALARARARRAAQ